MTRSPKAAQYERTSRLRRIYDVQANMLGWTKLDVLAAYLTEEDELVTFDKDERRLSGSAVPLPAEIENARIPEIVQPADVSAPEFGPRWQRARANMAKALLDGGALDFQATDRAALLSNLETVAASFLRGVQLLRENSGPDWREALGLESSDV